MVPHTVVSVRDVMVRAPGRSVSAHGALMQGGIGAGAAPGGVGGRREVGARVRRSVDPLLDRARPHRPYAHAPSPLPIRPIASGALFQFF